jgi:hypothetical protein
MIKVGTSVPGTLGGQCRARECSYENGMGDKQGALTSDLKPKHTNARTRTHNTLVHGHGQGHALAKWQSSVRTSEPQPAGRPLPFPSASALGPGAQRGLPFCQLPSEGPHTQQKPSASHSAATACRHLRASGLNLRVSLAALTGRQYPLCMVQYARRSLSTTASTPDRVLSWWRPT